MTFKKISAVLTAFVLAILMAFQLPAQVFADSRPVYISEIKISYAELGYDRREELTKPAAQKELTDAGYTLLTFTSAYKENGKTIFKKGDPVDLNYGTDTALTSEPPAVYLGYKTTKDKDEAITDISMMEMAKESDKNQPYSFAAYDEMLKEYKKEINASIANIEDTVTEFAANYKKGSPAAKWAYEQLNRYKDPDIEKNNKIGDILLSMANDGFTDDEKEQLQTYFLKGNINFVNAMNTDLGVGCAEYQTEDTWIERFAQASADDEYNKSYDSTVEALLSGWSSFYEILDDFEKTGLDSDCTDEEAEKYVEKQNSTEAAENVRGLQTVRILSKYEYDGESMLDFFMESSDSDDIDKEKLIPLAASLTNGQRATVKQMGISGLFSILDNTSETWETLSDETEETISDMADSMDVSYKKGSVISIYDGVNEAMYDSSGVALTSEAMTKQASTEDGDGWFSEGYNTIMFITGIVSASIGVIGLTTMLIKTFAVNIGTIEHPMMQYQFGLTLGQKWMYGGSIGLMLIGAGILVGSWIYNYYHTDYTEIPAVMVDAVSKTSKQGITSTYYTYYDAVKCDYDEQTDIPADMNGWTGRRWNAMYTTKDELAGDPILVTYFTAQYGSKEKKNCTPVARFHEESAYNMNAHHYADDVNGIYLFYTSDDGTANYEGTVISTVDLGLGIGGGAIGGFAVAASTMYAKFKNMLKKKKTTTK